MRGLLALAILALLLCAPGGTARADPPASSPVGRWLTANGDGIIQIAPCVADAVPLCGRLVGFTHPEGGRIPDDWQGQSECGLRIIDEAIPDGGQWKGRITDPSSGTAYHVALRVDMHGRLHVRGYLGVELLGQTQVWTMFVQQLTPACRIG